MRQSTTEPLAPSALENSRHTWVELDVALRDRHWTVADLARLTGLRYDGIAAARLGYNQPGPRMIATLAEVLGVTREALTPAALRDNPRYDPRPPRHRPGGGSGGLHCNA